MGSRKVRTCRSPRTRSGPINATVLFLQELFPKNLTLLPTSTCCAGALPPPCASRVLGGGDSLTGGAAHGWAQTPALSSPGVGGTTAQGPHVLPPGVQNSVLPRSDLQPCYPTRPCRASCPRAHPRLSPSCKEGVGGRPGVVDLIRLWESGSCWSVEGVLSCLGLCPQAWGASKLHGGRHQ